MLNFPEQLALAPDQINGMQAILVTAANPVAQMMSNNERTQLIQSRMVMVANIDIVNEKYQEFAVINVDILNENITQNYLAQYTGLRIEQNCSALLQRLIGQSTAIETQLNSIVFEDCIQNNIDEFNVMRQIQVNSDGLYPTPVLDDLHVGLSETYRETIIQNVVTHLLNFSGKTKDINAVCNIRNIVTQYITANYDLDSRPEQLSRRRQDVAPNEES
ncbi:hypothetical protein BDF21DRAFT_492106 [Thamnidium elegans]|nr:hypothetical protein BDF21DRAFT_492106 [Thamnidium elegans]